MSGRPTLATVGDAVSEPAQAYTEGRRKSERTRLPDEQYITVAQASRLSGLSTRHIARLLREGTIKGIKPGHDWLLKPSAVMEYLKQGRKPGRKRKAGKNVGCLLWQISRIMTLSVRPIV